MLRKILLVGAGLVALTAATSANAQSSASVNGTASVQILKPIAITAPQALVFGRVASPNSGTSTVTIAPAGTVSPASGLPSGGPSRTAAQFTVTGEESQAITLTVPASITLNGPSSATLTVSSVNHNAGGSPALDSTGNLTFGVGGTLTVPTAATAGAYTGSFSVTAAYN